MLAVLALVSVVAWLARSLPTISEPPSGAHAWRETDGLIVARNYCLERAPFLEPRVNNRGQTDGRTGLEFPLLNYVAGRLGCDSGDVVTPWRVLSLLFAGLLVAGVWWAGKALFGPEAGMGAVVCFATSPLTAYFSRATQPDMAAAALAALALATVAVAGGWGRTTLAFALMTLAALLKLPAAVYLLPVVLLSLRGSSRSMTRVIAVLALAGVGMLAVLAWYRHALALQAETGIGNFQLTRSARQLLAEWRMPTFWTRSFVQLPFDLWVFPGAMVLLLGVLAWRGRATPWEVGALGASVLAHVFLCGYSGVHHTYYAVMLLPALSLMVGWAVMELVGLRARAVPLALAISVASAIGWQVHRDRLFWPTRQREWAQLTAFSSDELGPQGRTRVVVFSDGSPELFWFSGQIGRFAAVEVPALAPADGYALVDRVRLVGRTESIEAALMAGGCVQVFQNAVGWICRAPDAPVPPP